MPRFTSRCRDFLINDDGPTASEYAILLSLVVVMSIVALRAFGGGMIGITKTLRSAMVDGPER
ncbi:MAG: hypothetical protein KDA32_00720 [Phycisphaerales bacterium]|nr:hypothetical protein [Phycisphaerales bacterium]